MAPSPGWLAWCLLLCGSHVRLVGLGPVVPTRMQARCPVVLPTINRRERRHLTQALNQTWSSVATSPISSWALLHRHGRQHHPKQRFTWLQRLRRRCGLTGVRVGEASHPGPEDPSQPSAMEVDAGLARVFCPVPGCPCADRTRARGWANHISMRHHIDAHLSGSLQGKVPPAWLHTRADTLPGLWPQCVCPARRAPNLPPSPSCCHSPACRQSARASATILPGHPTRQHANPPPRASQCSALMEPDFNTSSGHSGAPQ